MVQLEPGLLSKMQTPTNQARRLILTPRSQKWRRLQKQSLSVLPKRVSDLNYLSGASVHPRRFTTNST